MSVKNINEGLGAKYVSEAVLIGCDNHEPQDAATSCGLCLKSAHR